jgi:hypothetical protein
MRRAFGLGLGLTAVLAGNAAAQFGSPPPAEKPAPAATPPAATPMTPPSYVPPVGVQPAAPTNSFRPAGAPAAQPALEIPLALGQNHPLAVKPEDGNYFICVKSYSRPHNPDERDRGYTVKQLAEGLAAEIQTAHKTRVFLYELISDEKKAQAQAQAAAKQRAAEFTAALEQYRQKAQLQGLDFIDADRHVKYQTFQYRDQVAVLIGGFQTEDEAVKALAVVKKWPIPGSDKRWLLDGAAITYKDKDGKPVIEKDYLNPYAHAMVVQNPTVQKQLSNGPVPLDPFIVKLNDGRPYSLLKTTKKWTLAVKSFSAPVHYVSKDEDASMVRRIGFSKDAEVLKAGAEQAEALAKALREMKGRGGEPLNLEAYVLHTRTASLVTVGQYDSPNDPELLEKQRILNSLTFNLSRDDKGQQITGTGQKLFGDQILPVPIPRH